MTKFALLLIPILLVSGCKKKTPPPVVETTPAVVDVVETPVVVAVTQETLDMMNEQFAKVHFEFDSDKLAPGSLEALAVNAGIMQKHPSIRIEIQGHADERGTADYNLALGDRRARAVEAYMAEMGVSPKRAKVVSYGEEVPEERASTPSAWSANRRCEFKILTAAPGVTGTTP